MTVQDMIKKLSKLDPTLEVCAQNPHENCFSAISGIDIQNELLNEHFEAKNVVVFL